MRLLRTVFLRLVVALFLNLRDHVAGKRASALAGAVRTPQEVGGCRP